LGIERGLASPGHFSSQLDPPPQETEQEGPHVTRQVEPLVHETEALAPNVNVQLDWSQLRFALLPIVKMQVLLLLQLASQLFAQVPEHCAALTQLSEELPPSGAQEQAVPL
jgi:hypothetical protein